MAYNFRRGDRDQPFLLPPDLRDWLPEGHLAWFILDVTDQLDLQPFLRAYRADGHGHPAYYPKTLLGVLLYAYAIGVRSSRQLHRRAGAVVAVDPHHPATPVAPHTGPPHAGAYLGAGPCGGAHQDRVQHIPPRRHHQVDPSLILDRPTDRLATGIERDLPDRRGAAVQHPIQQPPTVQLDNTATRDRMRRDRIAGKQRLVHHHHHVMPETSQQHRSGRPSHTCNHHNHVMTATVHGMHDWDAPVSRTAAASDPAA